MHAEVQLLLPAAVAAAAQEYTAELYVYLLHVKERKEWLQWGGGNTSR